MAAASLVLALALISVVGFVRPDDEVNTKVSFTIKKNILGLILMYDTQIGSKGAPESVLRVAVPRQRSLRSQPTPAHMERTWISVPGN